MVSNVLDKVIRFEKTGRVEWTHFLNLNEYLIVDSILNLLKISYHTYTPCLYASKKILFFLPDHFELDDDFYSHYVACVKVIPNKNQALQHKDYMGSIYHLGIKRENIGDIFIKDGIAYFFCMASIKDFILQNLTHVGKQEVQTQEIMLDQEEIKDLSVSIMEKDYIVPSFRVDAICSSVFGMSRSQVKEKVKKGDLYVNDKVVYETSMVLHIGDQISFHRQGKLIVKEEVRKTKNGSIVLKVGKFC